MRGPPLGSVNKTGLRASLLAFFRDNPEEYLSVCDAAVKFNASKSVVRDCSNRMRKLGELAPGYPLRLPEVVQLEAA